MMKMKRVMMNREREVKNELISQQQEQLEESIHDRRNEREILYEILFQGIEGKWKDQMDLNEEWIDRIN